MRLAMQQLNIKNNDAHQLAVELAEITGQSLSAAVTTALRNELEREKRLHDHDGRIRRIEEITQSYRDKVGKPLPTREDMDEWMYDESGLPR
jgi:antitoxin VapB